MSKLQAGYLCCMTAPLSHVPSTRTGPTPAHTGPANGHNTYCSQFPSAGGWGHRAQQTLTQAHRAGEVRVCVEEHNTLQRGGCSPPPPRVHLFPNPASQRHIRAVVSSMADPGGCGVGVPRAGAAGGPRRGSPTWLGHPARFLGLPPRAPMPVLPGPCRSPRGAPVTASHRAMYDTCVGSVGAWC